MSSKDLYIKHLIDVIEARCNVTKEHIEFYKPYLSNNRNLANFNLKLKELIFTLGIGDADGAYFTDLNGNRYLDVSMGFGVHLFGHKVSFLEEAILKQLKKGIALGPLYQEAAEVAKLIEELTGAERCAFYNSGTEAVMVAMRIARAASKKDKVVIFEGSYHGTHDSLLAIRTDPVTNSAITSIPGITQKAVDNTIILKYGDIDSINFISKNAEDIAAVLIEPVMSRHPEIANQEFLNQLRSICTNGEVALIFDEVITGFRVSNVGASQYFDIVPDIRTFGKILGGGITIGAVAGKKYYLDTIDGGYWKFGDDSVPQVKTTFTAGTFNHHPLAMAAAKATLLYLKEDNGKLQQSLNTKTKDFCTKLNGFFELEGYPITMVYFGSLFRIKVNGAPKLIFYSLLKEGIYIWEGRTCFLSTAHTDNDMELLIAKIKKCCFELVAAGILNSKKKPLNSMGKMRYMLAAVEIAAELDSSILNFVCNYLFESIDKLRPLSCLFHCIELSENELNNVKDVPTDSVILSIFKNKNKTIIQFSGDKDICDGWSIILFFKALAKSYTAVINKMPLPDIHLPIAEDSIRKDKNPTIKGSHEVLAAKTIHSCISYDEIPDEMNNVLFSFLLYNFYKAVREVDIIEEICIDIPMAGQLLTRKLNTFDKCTVYYPMNFGTNSLIGVHDKTKVAVGKIESLLNKAKFSYKSEEETPDKNELVFNMDNLNFNLTFNNQNAKLLPVDEGITSYKMVCNVSKLSDHLDVSLKYSGDSITEETTNHVLNMFLQNIRIYDESK